MSSLIGITLPKRRTQNLETLHYYVLCTLFPLTGYLDDQCSKFLKLWMDYLGCGEFPDLRPSLIKGECMENILPNGRCFADVMTKMHHAVLTIPRDSPCSPFSISPQ